MIKRLQNHFRSIATLMLPFVILGCGGGDGPELGQVEGKVTLDGTPLSGAQVLFQPENGRPSTGTTDSEGHYELQYTRDRKGAMVGTHKVSITTFAEPDPDGDTPEKQKGSEEKIPARYNVNTELKAEVVAGSNDPFNFDLKSGGKIIKAGEEDDSNQSQRGCE